MGVQRREPRATSGIAAAWLTSLVPAPYVVLVRVSFIAPRALAIAVAAAWSAAACSEGAGPAPTTPPSNDGGAAPPLAPTPDAAPSSPCASDTYDVDQLGVPAVLEADYIDLARVARISKFRSGIGHNYSDTFEACRSMKHYFVPTAGSDWSTVPIYAPAKSAIVALVDDFAGKQVHLRVDACRPFTVILFHVAPARALTVGDAFAAGEAIGTHVGSQTFSDVAVRVDTPRGMKLVSYFSVLRAGVFDRYRARGASLPDDFLIPLALRDRSPLTCDGETFGTPGTLENWIESEVGRGARGAQRARGADARRR